MGNPDQSLDAQKEELDLDGDRFVDADHAAGVSVVLAQQVAQQAVLRRRGIRQRRCNSMRDRDCMTRGGLLINITAVSTAIMGCNCATFKVYR